MSIERIETAAGPRWRVRRKVGHVHMKKSCKTLVEAERLYSEWAVMTVPPKPRVGMNAQEICDSFLRRAWI